MYIRTKENQTRHDIGVGSWASQLVTGGWALVRSDLPGNIKPPTIGKYIPDIYGKNGYQEIIIEIETQDSKDSPHTKDQLLVFTAWKNQAPNNRIFLIKVV